MSSYQRSACVALLKHVRSVYSEAAPSVIEHQQFYSNVVQKAAMQPVETLSLRQVAHMQCSARNIETCV